MTNREERSARSEQEASGMNSQRWPRMVGQSWPGSGRWGVAKLLHVQLDRKRETERRQREAPGC